MSKKEKEIKTKAFLKLVDPQSVVKNATVLNNWAFTIAWTISL